LDHLSASGVGDYRAGRPGAAGGSGFGKERAVTASQPAGPGPGVVGLDPTSGPLAAAEGRLARRRDDLAGAVLGLVSNGLGESDKILAAVGAEVSRLAGLQGTVAVRKPSVSVPPDPIDWERLINQATVALAGFGG
jgi:hypothetical protein